jgi:putative ABC transport system permease protein
MSDEPMWRRYRDVVRPRSREDLDAEVDHHLRMREQEAIRAGLDPNVARAAARERFGNVDGVVAELRTIDRHRERRRSRIDWLADVRQDARFALRSMRRAPGFAVTAIATMAVAIAANTTIFSFVNALLLEPLPYARPSELVTIDANVIGSVGELLALRRRHPGFADVAMIRPRTVTYGDDRDAARLDGVSITPNLLPLLGVAPEVGHAFADDATRPGAGNVILLSYSFWLERYGGDRSIVGRYVVVDGAQAFVAGVMPASFAIPSTRTQFWMPLTIDATNAGATWGFGGGRWIARLAPGVPLSRATTELAAVLPGFRRLNPLWDPGADYGKNVAAHPLQRSLIGAGGSALLLMFGCVAVVLLVACVNLANLMLARVAAREREFIVRSALGSGRGRVVRQLLTESVVIALVGGTLGLAFALAGVRWMAASLPPDMPRTADVRFDGGVFAFTAILAIATGVAFGLLPALRAAAGSSRGPSDAAHLTRSGAAQHRLASVLVGGEVALAVLLAITAGLLTRSFQQMSELSPGFSSGHVVTALVSPPAASFADTSRTSAFYRTVIERVSAIPGVSAVGLASHIPIAAPIYGLGMRVQGQFEDATHLLPTADHMQVVTPGYFPALGIPIVNGRAFTDGDGGGAPQAAIVSRSLARRFWPNGDAIGKRVGYPWSSPWITVVGVVPDVRIDSLRDTSALAIYIPFAQRVANSAPEMSIVVRTIADPSSIARELREIVRSIDGTVPVSAIQTMDDVISRSVAKPRFTTAIVGGFAVATLLLGAVGIFGVTSYVVSQRTHEIGVRMALGATSADIASDVLRRVARIAGWGALAGCGLALVATRALRSLLYGVSATDPTTFAAGTLSLIAVAILASLVPARRAMRADPVDALRGD